MNFNAVYLAVTAGLWNMKQAVNFAMDRILPVALPLAQFGNELTSVGAPVYALLQQAPDERIADNALAISLSVGALCGLNTAITTYGFQILSALHRVPEPKDMATKDVESARLPDINTSLLDSPPVQSLSRPLQALAFSSCAITVAQWNANNIFLSLELSSSWFKHRLSLIETAYVTAAYVLFQLPFDWFSDGVEGINGFLDHYKYQNLVHSMSGCSGALMRSQRVRNMIRLNGCISQVLGRLLPLVVWLDPDTLGWEKVIGFSALIALLVGVPVGLQIYLFEGQTVEDNARELAHVETQTPEAWLPYFLGKLFHLALYLGGPLDAVDSFLGPYAFALALGAPDWVPWFLGVFVGVIVGLGGAYIEVPEAQAGVRKLTRERGLQQSAISGISSASASSIEAAVPRSTERTHLLADGRVGSVLSPSRSAARAQPLGGVGSAEIALSPYRSTPTRALTGSINRTEANGSARPFQARRESHSSLSSRLGLE